MRSTSVEKKTITLSTTFFRALQERSQPLVYLNSVRYATCVQIVPCPCFAFVALFTISMSVIKLF